MMKTWLIRRAVRRPVLPEVTSRISSSVCRLPFINSSPLDLADQLDRLGGGRFAMRHVDDLEAADIQTVLARRLEIFARRPDQDRHDDAGVGRFERPPQRCFVAGMDDDGGRGRHLFGAGDEPFVFRGRRRAERADCRKRSDLTVAVAKHVHSFAPTRSAASS